MIPKTRQIHQVTNSPVPYVINKMRPSCLCPGCLTSDAALCSNFNIVKPLESFKLILNQVVKHVPEIEEIPLVDLDDKTQHVH